MGKFKPFEIGLMVIFGLLAVGAVVAVRLINPESGPAPVPVTVWGTIPRVQVDPVLAALKESNPQLSLVTYVEKRPESYYRELIEVFASGSSLRPSLFLVDQARFLEFENKVYDLSTTLSQAVLRQTYVEAAEVFSVRGATRAIPFSVDPLILYYNRDLLTNAGIATVPETWTDVIALAPKLTVYGAGGSLTQSTIAFGEYDNVANAKPVLSALFLQGGYAIVSNGSPTTPMSVALRRAIGQTSSDDTLGAVAAVRYYTDFSNPAKTVYNWNKAQPRDRERFLGGKLAFYIGFMSEFDELRAGNPNLNFEVAELPQRPGAPRKTTYARVVGLVVPKQVPLPEAQAAVQVASILTGREAHEQFARAAGLPPLRRDLIAPAQSTTRASVGHKAALSARSWLEPGEGEADAALRAMIESINSGAESHSTALGACATRLEYALGPFIKR